MERQYSDDPTRLRVCRNASIHLAVPRWKLASRTKRQCARRQRVVDSRPQPLTAPYLSGDACCWKIKYLRRWIALAIRSGARGWWAAVSLAQVVVLAGLVTVNVTWSDLPGRSQFMLGIGFPFAGWRQALQMLLPLALGWFAMRWRQSQATAVA